MNKLGCLELPLASLMSRKSHILLNSGTLCDVLRGYGWFEGLDGHGGGVIVIVSDSVLSRSVRPDEVRVILRKDLARALHHPSAKICKTTQQRTINLQSIICKNSLSRIFNSVTLMPPTFA